MKTIEISYDKIKSLGTLGGIEIEHCVQNYCEKVAKIFHMRTENEESANACIEMFHQEHGPIMVPQDKLLYEIEKTIAMYKQSTQPQLVLKHRFVYSEKAGISWREIYDDIAKDIENIIFKDDPEDVEVLKKVYGVSENHILYFEDNTGQNYIFFLRPKEYVLTH